MLERAAAGARCAASTCAGSVSTATQYVGVFQAMREQSAARSRSSRWAQLDEATGQQQVHLYVLRKGYTASDLSK